MTSSLSLSSSSSLLSLSLLLFVLLCGNNNKVNAEEVTIVDSVDLNVDKYYNVNESRGEFEFRIKDYPLPIATTTYADFIFNLPEDLPPLVHIVFGEAIISQPKHLHHFILTGCTTKRDTDIYEEGTALDYPSSDCLIPLGQWAPGSSVFGTTPDLSVGVAIGRAMGIQAVQLNIHYTDGEYENDDGSETYKIATDGIKVYYTPDLRDYTSISKLLIDVPTGPSELYVPPSTERFFLTKTCLVDTKCKDATEKQLQDLASVWFLQEDGDDDDIDSGMSEMLANLSSCPTMKQSCSSDVVQQLCPVSCGFCDTDNNEVNPRNPTSYRATSINYHAHLLGSEMYATLLRAGGGDDEEQEDLSSSLTQKQADLSTTPRDMIVKDLKSSEFWNFDYQTSIAMDGEYEIQVGTSTTSDENEGEEGIEIELVRGVEIKPGDKIQTTCVYNSMYRDEKTRFGLSTYDEMCLIALQITYKTPPVNTVDNDIDIGTAVGISLSADLILRTFSCDSSTPVLSDIWQGTLDTNEDPRNIWEDHPITTTDMCTFPVADYVLFDKQQMTEESRNCPANDNNDYNHDSGSICYGFETDNGSGGGGKIEFLDDAIAVYMCVGGTYDGQVSTKAPLYLTEENCLVDGGGTSYDPNTCEEVDEWLRFMVGITDEEIKYIKENWFQPSCCREVIAAVIIEDGDVNDVDSEVGAAGATTTTTVTTEEESSSSTYSSAVSFAIVVSSVVIMMAS